MTGACRLIWRRLSCPGAISRFFRTDRQHAPTVMSRTQLLVISSAFYTENTIILILAQTCRSFPFVNWRNFTASPERRRADTLEKFTTKRAVTQNIWRTTQTEGV